MSRNFVVLSKVLPSALHPEHGALHRDDPRAAAMHPPETRSADRPNEFAAVIRQLFDVPAAVAIVGAGASDRAGGPASEDAAYRIARGLAKELGASGKRVILVPVSNLLRMNPINIPDPADFVPGGMPYVWLWPPAVSHKIEFFRPAEASREAGVREHWLDALRRDFDAVVLDCPGVEVAGVTDVAAMADAAVLAVHAGRTSSEQLRHCQQALQLRGARVVGSILLKPSEI